MHARHSGGRGYSASRATVPATLGPLEDDSPPVVRESDDRIRQGDERVTTVDVKEVKG
jgi:hypothetical protein